MIEINYFQELFLSTDIWGWFGPCGLVILGLLFSKKDTTIAIVFILLDSLLIAYYASLLSTTGWYIWNMLILLVGVITCMFRFASR